MEGPAAWATLLDRLNRAIPMATREAGSSVMINWNESGISTAPAAPWTTRIMIMLVRFGEKEQATEATRNTLEPTSITRRSEKTSTSHAVSGIMTISATR
ncbi:Uncharacterised protein [Pseudomonas aeruginosa]|nr:Uncharacterised protein [Pseudomonas aeruginosa]